MGYRFEIFEGTNRQYYWRFVAPNGETMCHSEGYTTKQNAQHGANSVKANSFSAHVYDQT